MPNNVEDVARMRWGRVTYALLLSALALSTTVLILVALAPRELLAGLLAPFSPDGTIQGLDTMVGRARWLAILVSLITAGFWYYRVAFVRWTESAWRDLGSLLDSKMGAGRAALARRDPAAWALLVIVVVGALLRGAHLAEPVEYDEAWTVLDFVAQPLPIGLSTQREANNHLFHTLVARPFFLLGGYRMWAIRIPVFIAGVLLIPMTFILGRAMGGTAVGLWSAAISVAAGPTLLYSFRARGYAFVALAFVVLLVLAYRILRWPGARGAWLAFVITASLGAFTVPAMFYPFLAVVFWLLVASWDRPPAERRRFYLALAAACGAVGVLTFLLYTPLLLVSGPGRLLRPPFAAPVSLSAFLVYYGSAEPWLALGRYLSDPLPSVVAIGLATAAVLGSFKWIHRGSEPSPALGLLAVPVAVFLQRVLPPERVFTFVVPLVAATACVGLSGTLGALSSGRPGWLRHQAWAAAFAAVLLAGVTQWRSDFFLHARHLAGYDDPKAVAACLERLGPEDALLVKGVVLWPTRFLLAAEGMPSAWLSAHRQERFSGRLWAVSVQDPLEVAVQEELDDGRTRPELMAFSRPVSTCGNATLHEMAPTAVGADWASTPAAQPDRVAP